MVTEGTEPESKRVLLVDDDYEIIESLRIVLEAKGYEVLVARDGNQGLAMAEREVSHGTGTEATRVAEDASVSIGLHGSIGAIELFDHRPSARRSVVCRQQDLH